MREDTEFRKYCCKDSHATLLASYSLERELAELNLLKLYHRIVQPLAQVIIGLNMRGIMLDTSKRDAAVTSIEKEIDEAQEMVDELLGRKINVRGEAFGYFLFEELELTGGKRTKKGKWKTDEKTLNEAAKKHPDIAPLINTAITIREKKKLIETFLSVQISEDGRIYPTFRIGPSTGRLACRRPNLQNVPEGVCREMYVAPTGKKFVYADYSQIELRILALLAHDELLLQVFASGKDVHDANARVLFKLSSTDVITYSQRVFAKVFIYGLMYGAEVSTIVSNLQRGLKGGIASFAVVQEMSNNFFAAHPAIVKFRSKLKLDVISHRRLTNVFGRPRVFFGPLANIIREAYNFPMQSAAADIVNLAMIDTDKEIPGAMILQIHDALILEVGEQDASGIAIRLKEILERPIVEFNNYRFPAKVKIGGSWGDFN